jgi:phospholipid transport system substrate-binding protein
MFTATLTVGAGDADAGTPTGTLQDFFGAVNIVLRDPRTEDQPLEKLRVIRRHVDDVFDFREAAMLALGREWAVRTALEQNEFVALFADLLERSFVWRVAGKAALGDGVRVDYRGETTHDDMATVDTAVAARDGNDLRLQFRMVRRAERWAVRDVVMDGVSTMENYHAQFLRVVRDASWQELVRLVRAKVGAPAGIVQVAAPTAAPSPPAPAPVVASLSPPEIDRFVAAERQALARDVAAVVTPGLAVPDVTSAGPPRSRREVAAVAPPPTVAAVAPLRPIEPPASVMTPAAARPNPAPRVWIQVGAFKNPTMAGRVAEQVDGLILVVAPRGRAEPLLRVRVGPFPDRAHAAARLREIQSLGYRAFIIAAGD